MKLLLMTSLWGRHGGKEHYLECCVEELTRSGHQCVIAYGRLSSKSTMLSMPSMHTYELPAFRHVHAKDEEQSVEVLRRLLDLEAPDAIFMCDLRNLRLLSILHEYGGTVTMSHDNWLTCMRGLATSYFSRKICTGRLGYKCYLHGCFLSKDPADRSLVFNKLSSHRAILESYKHFSHHLVASNYMKRRLQDHGFSDKQLQVVGYFTDLQTQTRELAKDAVPTILYMGQIHKYKGLDFLIRALRLLKGSFQCRIIGDGDQIGKCKALAVELGLTDKIHFLGWLPRPSLNEELLNAHVIAVPSVWPEPFGLVGLEAMTCGKPTVAFDTGGISDWLVDGVSGYLVPVKDVQQLARKIEYLLTKPQQAVEMGRQGQRIAKDRFSRAKHFQALTMALEEASDARKRKGSPSASSASFIQLTGTVQC